jgi:hypothetical protein
MRIASATIFALLVVLVPAASAAGVRVPPGNGAATQYSETVPGAGGEEGTREGKPSAGSKGGQTKSAVPAATTAELEELGREGKTTLDLAEQGAPRRQPAKGASGGGHKDRRAVATATTAGPNAGGGGSGVGEVLGAAVGTSGGGLGFMQPLILATVLLGAGAYLLGHRRKGRANLAGRSQR